LDYIKKQKSKQYTLMKVNINISDLAIGYNKKALIENINLSTEDGQFISIIGRNGEGKSTLLRTIASLTPSLSGKININQVNLDSISETEKSKLISIVLTNKLAIHNITVFDYISYGRYPYTNWLGIKSESDNTLVNEAITLCDIAHLTNNYFTELSDGEKQKVNIARAITQNTPIIILDEPTAHLDLVNKIEVFKLLKKLVDNYQKTTIISTHQVELALQLSNCIWMIAENQIIQGEPTEIIKSGNINKLFNSSDITFNYSTNSFTIK